MQSNEIKGNRAHSNALKSSTNQKGKGHSGCHSRKCWNTCFSSSVVFNTIDSHGTEAYIKSKYIIKRLGKEEWAW